MNKPFTPAPLGVNWGTTNIPISRRIDTTKEARTRNGKRVINLHIKLDNGNGCESTFPIKGMIVMQEEDKDADKSEILEYEIWTLNGHASLFGDHELDLIHPLP